MSDIIVKKIKKYVLYISAIFFVITAVHLGYIYTYDGAESEAIEWWTISEAIIWSFPHFNPLVPSNDHNAYINGLLYRSMMEYNVEKWVFESDLVSCNTDNLLLISCSLENNLLWSNETEITTEDIKSTLLLIKDTKVNPIIASLLSETTIETSEDTISFSNQTKDINFLQIFLQPILPESLIDRLDKENIEGKFSEVNGIYSWRFLLKNISQDETVGITKITLAKNEFYNENEMYIQFLILNLFRDEWHFLKNKNSFNIFNDKDSIIAGSIPRLTSHEYTLSQFVWSFMNTETLGTNFREYLSSSIDRESIVNAIWSSKVSPAFNPFLSGKSIDIESTDFNLPEYLESKWYYKKTALLKSALAQEESEKQEQQNLISNEVKPESTEALVIEKTQEKLNYVRKPYSDKYNFVTKDNILIEWSVESGTEAVYINDYQLSWFTPWDNVFYYRLLESYDTISEWENSYKVYFEKDWKKELKEEFFYIYNTDKATLDLIESEYFGASKPSSISLPKEISEETTQENLSQSWSSQESSSSDDTENVSKISIIENDLSLSKIQSLDEAYYYDAAGLPFTLNLVYAQSDSNMETTIQSITTQLKQRGILIKPKALSLWDITVQLRNESLEYDMIVLGINLWYFDSNLFPYFHSSQVKNGYNLWNFKKLSLDILLEELKSNNLSITKREELEAKMLDIISAGAIVKVLYTPKTQLLIDKNIKNYYPPKHMPDARHRYYPLLKSYLTEKRIVKKEEKSIYWFFSYLAARLLP